MELLRDKIEDVFFTSNESLYKVNEMLDTVNSSHPKAHNIGCDVSFLDVHIENKDGTLTASVHHREASDHFKHIFGNISNTTLL